MERMSASGAAKADEPAASVWYDSAEREKTATFARVGSTLGGQLVGVVVMPIGNAGKRVTPKSGSYEIIRAGNFYSPLSIYLRRNS